MCSLPDNLVTEILSFCLLAGRLASGATIYVLKTVKLGKWTVYLQVCRKIDASIYLTST